MKIHKTVNPVAYENTYYLEGEKHLIVVDPGSHWEAIRQTIKNINKPICAILLTHCLLYTSPSPRDYAASRMPSSA